MDDIRRLEEEIKEELDKKIAAGEIASVGIIFVSHNVIDFFY